MIYTQNLDELIFRRHEMFDSDELIVVSGYLGPKPVSRLEELPFNSKVIYGMYGSEGIRPTLHSSLLGLQENVNNLNIYYSQLPVHSKCYIWKIRGQIIHALIGSANFSINGLTTPFREVLTETTVDSFDPLSMYLDHIFNNSISCLEVGDERVTEDIAQQEFCRMTLLDPATNEVQAISGLNWGQNPRSHTTPDDAYVPVRVSHIRDFPSLFQPKQLYPLVDDSRGREQRHNDSIEMIWDDGITMEGLFEGSQPVDDQIYPKQVSSFPRKSQLGQYIRNKIGVPSGQPVRKHHLDTYGRSDIDVSLLGDGVYKFDFSV